MTAKWETLGQQKRECKYYRLTPLGRKRLEAEETKWHRLTRAIGAVLTAAKA